MTTQNVRFEYPYKVIPLILRSSFHEDLYYGMDEFEMKRVKIILAKYGPPTSFNVLPGKVFADLHPFQWNQMGQCYRIDMDKKVPVQLNTLEEVVANKPIFSKG